MFSFDPYSPEIDANPFPAYKILRDEYPCFYSNEANMWVLSRYDDIVAALNDWQTYSSAKGNLMTELPNRAGSTLGTTDPPRHDRLRGLIQHAFMKRNLESLYEPIREIAKDLCNNLKDKKEFDFIGDFSSKFTTRVIIAALGLPMVDEVEIRNNAVLMVQSDPITRQKGPEHLKAFEWVKNFAANTIIERRKNPQNDLISHFSIAQIDGDKLSEDEVLLTTTTLIMAGIESLGGFMAMFGLNMADFEDARLACINNKSLIPDAIEESLRFNTSAQRFRRCLTKDIDLYGKTMKAGDFVCLAYGSGNRDERRFENADNYDISRKPKGHLGFGGSVHACLGTAVARLAVKAAFEEMLEIVPNFKRMEAELKWMPSSTFRSPLELKLKVI